MVYCTTETMADASIPQQPKQRPFRWFNVAIILFMAFGSIEYGYSSSLISTTLAQPSFIHFFELDTRGDADTLTGLMNSLFQAGGFLGIWTVPVVSDRFGRKTAISYCAVVCLIATIGLTASRNIETYLVFRFISGWGAWTIVSAIPIWMNEVSPPNIRGILVDCHNVGFLLGYNLATWAGYGFYHLPATNNWAWRGPQILQALWVVILLSGMRWLPESPRYLMMIDRHEEAEKTLYRLHAASEARVEALQIRISIENDRHHESSWWSIITRKSYRKRALFAIGMALSIHTSGILVVNNYGATIYASLGYDANTQLLLLVGWCGVALVTGFMSFFLIDRVARNKLLAIGVGGCAACLAVVCGLVGKFTSKEALQAPNTAALQATVAFIYLLNCFYQLGLGKSTRLLNMVPLFQEMWLLTLTITDGVQFCSLGEIFPTHLRAKGVVIGVATITAINIVWLQTAPIAFRTIGYKFYMVFFIPGFVATAWLWFYFPNTLGMRLEEIGQMFGDTTEFLDPDSNNGSEKKHAFSSDAKGPNDDAVIAQIETKV
jgi:MFS family permease